MKIRDKVLIVEDEQNIKNFMSTILAANGFDTLMAGSAKEALSMISSHCPDLIILDLGLPDMDGMEVLKQVRAWSSVPVIVVSARTHEGDKVAALDLGADDYIEKPFGTSELLARIRTAIRHTRTGLDNDSIAQSGKYTVRDLTIDYDPLCFTQGEITAVAEDGSWFDVRIDEGYPVTGLAANRVQFYDPQTRLLKRNSITTYTSNYSALKQLGHNLFRAVKNGTWSAGEQVGDLVVMDVKTDKPNAGVHTVMLNKCYNTKLENVTVYGSNTFSFFEKEGYANEYRNCVVDRGPMPQGIRPRLRSGNADGIHSSQARKGPTVTGCKVGHNGDDCIIVCGRSFPVGSADAAKGTIDLVTRETHPVFRRGDRLVVVGYDGKRKGELRLVSVSRFDPTEEQRNAVTTGYPSLLSKASYKLGFRLKVKQMPFEIGPGDVVFNADAVGSGFLVKDNEVGHVRSRGILIKGIDGVVASNRITGCAMQGILMSPEIEWMGGGFSSNVQIVGNTIEECMFERGNPRIPPGALSLFYITGDAKVAEPGAFINITVQKNKVTGCPCPAIAVTSVDGLKMSDNEVENSKEVTRSHGERYGADTGAPVWEKNNIKK